MANYNPLNSLLDTVKGNLGTLYDGAILFYHDFIQDKPRHQDDPGSSASVSVDNNELGGLCYGGPRVGKKSEYGRPSQEQGLLECESIDMHCDPCIDDEL